MEAGWVIRAVAPDEPVVVVVVAGGAAVVAETVVAQSFIFSESAWSVNFLFSQQVLKWLQNPLLKNEMLLHFASSVQDFSHAARSACLPDD